MKKRLFKILIYLLLLISTSTILAINYIYYKPSNIQIIGILIIMMMAIILKRFIPANRYKIIFYAIFIIILLAVRTSLNDDYLLTINKNSDEPEPLYIIPEKGIAPFEASVINNQDYIDAQFKGIISFGGNTIYICDLNLNENRRIQMESIVDVTYNEGLIYVTSDVNNEGMELSIFDINTLEKIKTISYSNYIELHRLNNTIFIVNIDTIYQLSTEFELVNGIPFVDGTIDAKYWNNYYLFERENDNHEFELLVYNKEFEFIKKLLTTSNKMVLSNNIEGELFVSVAIETDKEPQSFDLYFYVYDRDLNKKYEYQITENSTYRGLSLFEYNGYYLVNFLNDERHPYKNGRGIFYDKSFETGTLIFQYTNFTQVYIIDEQFYVTNYATEKVYKITDKDYFKSDTTLTITPPFSNFLFYSAVFIYPILCINTKSKKKDNNDEILDIRDNPESEKYFI